MSKKIVSLIKANWIVEIDDLHVPGEIIWIATTTDNISAVAGLQNIVFESQICYKTDKGARKGWERFAKLNKLSKWKIVIREWRS